MIRHNCLFHRPAKYDVNGVNSVTDVVSRVDISRPSNSNTSQSGGVGVGAPNSKCGMPLCILTTISTSETASRSVYPYVYDAINKFSFQTQLMKKLFGHNKHLNRIQILITKLIFI
ncbi:hypothetical protein L1887_34582 [Cichorium endivia]|nr:hypothetical protein L1887_34582 [Cichorium endivia]